MKKDLLQSLEEYGYLGRVVPAHHLRHLQEHITANYQQGRFEEEFYQECLANQFVFAPPESLPEVRSLIVVAARQPQIRFTFTWKDKQIPLIVPPTYMHWQETNRQVEKVLAQLLECWCVFGQSVGWKGADAPHCLADKPARQGGPMVL